MNVAQIKLDTKRLDEIAAKLKTNRDTALHRIAMQVEAHAKVHAPRDPKRMPQDPSVPTTGWLRSSIGAIPKSEGLYWVVVGADYGIWQEFGTSRMPARPFLGPAVEMTRKDINKIMGEEIFK